MKINQSLGVLSPSLVRRKQKSSKHPPWFLEVPPDTVDIALLPRINRYERGGLKFRQLGSTQQKMTDRLAAFREAMGEIEPGLAHSEAEMRTGLEAVMRERLRLIEEAEQNSQRRYDQVESSAQEQSTQQDALPRLDTELEQPEANSTNESSVQKVDVSSKQNTDGLTHQEQFESEPPPQETVEAASRALQGIPTDWLTRRLATQ